LVLWTLSRVLNVTENRLTHGKHFMIIIYRTMVLYLFSLLISEDVGLYYFVLTNSSNIFCIVDTEQA
jgi:hypothetical protein